jgi:hypothetical protein
MKPHKGRDHEDEDKIRERRKKAVAMRLAGATWQQVADSSKGWELGYSDRAHACADIRRAREKSQAELDESLEEMREMDLDRIGRLLAAVWSRAVNTKDEDQLKAIETAHRLVLSDAKLRGLEPPTKIMLMARIELESSHVASAVLAAIEALGLDPGQRMIALQAAQGHLRELESADASREQGVA